MDDIVFYCPFCSSELQPSASPQRCLYCGQEEISEWKCHNDHYICEECRLATPEDIIITTCSRTECKQPQDIAEIIMRHPSFDAHGIDHHLLTAPALLAAWNNSGIIDIAPAHIRNVIRRMQRIPYGACGSRGDCGACIGAGAAVSMALKASYRSDKERSLVLEASSRALMRLAEQGGPRCCKQSVWAAIETGQKIICRETGKLFVSPKIKCTFSASIDGCKKKACDYYEE